jgi:alpha-1,6-mannosyltransferase
VGPKAGVPCVMVSHESLAGLLALARTRARGALTDVLNARTAASYDRVVCTTVWAAAEFARIGAANLARVPLGVDLDAFHPARRDVRVRATYAREGEGLLVLCSRLSAEKRPDLALDAAAALADRGVPAVLAVVGDGPRRAALQRRAGAAGLPVRFTGFLPGQQAVAAFLASADVAIAPGPVETFGLAALEALACGTPVVVNRASALPEVVGDAGAVAAGDGRSLAAAVRLLLGRDPARCARTRASGRSATAAPRRSTASWPHTAPGAAVAVLP